MLSLPIAAVDRRRTCNHCRTEKKHTETIPEIISQKNQRPGHLGKTNTGQVTDIYKGLVDEQTSSVLLVHTGHDVAHLGPDDGKEKRGRAALSPVKPAVHGMKQTSNARAIAENDDERGLNQAAKLSSGPNRP